MGPAVVSVDAVMNGAEDYFACSGLGPILADALTQLAHEQPKDAVTALCRLLAATSACERASEDGKDPDEAIDLDTLPEDPRAWDPMGLVTLECLPGAKSGRGRDLSERQWWASGFNRPLLESWLPQPSPCCGAASVAGAFNALFDFGRDHHKSATIVEIAELMAKNCDRLYIQRQQRVERLLGIESGAFDTVLAALDQELIARGLSWEASGAQAATRAVATQVLREMAASRVGTEGEAGEAGFKALRRVLGLQTAQEESEEADPAECGGGKIVINVCGTNWDDEFGELFAKRRGSFRLRVEKPNTGEIGSWGIKQAVTDLSAARECDPMNAQVLLGRKGGPKAEVSVAKDDSADAMEHQWAALKTAFLRTHSVLLFHLTNHYALIYAWREWAETETTDSGEEFIRKRRQILTARKGQRPTVWLDFEEAHSIMVGWSGYHILQIQRNASSSSPLARVEVGSPGGA